MCSVNEHCPTGLHPVLIMRAQRKRDRRITNVDVNNVLNVDYAHTFVLLYRNGRN